MAIYINYVLIIILDFYIRFLHSDLLSDLNTNFNLN